LEKEQELVKNIKTKYYKYDEYKNNYWKIAGRKKEILNPVFSTLQTMHFSRICLRFLQER
jgi:hypothetical protein